LEVANSGNAPTIEMNANEMGQLPPIDQEQAAVQSNKPAIDMNSNEQGQQSPMNQEQAAVQSKAPAIGMNSNEQGQQSPMDQEQAAVQSNKPAIDKNLNEKGQQPPIDQEQEAIQSKAPAIDMNSNEQGQQSPMDQEQAAVQSKAPAIYMNSNEQGEQLPLDHEIDPGHRSTEPIDINSIEQGQQPPIDEEQEAVQSKAPTIDMNAYFEWQIGQELTASRAVDGLTGGADSNQQAEASDTVKTSVDVNPFNVLGKELVVDAKQQFAEQYNGALHNGQLEQLSIGLNDYEMEQEQTNDGTINDIENIPAGDLELLELDLDPLPAENTNNYKTIVSSEHFKQTEELRRNEIYSFLLLIQKSGVLNEKLSKC
jgi:hypothetical protein